VGYEDEFPGLVMGEMDVGGVLLRVKHHKPMVLYSHHVGYPRLITNMRVVVGHTRATTSI